MAAENDSLSHGSCLVLWSNSHAAAAGDSVEACNSTVMLQRCSRYYRLPTIQLFQCWVVCIGWHMFYTSASVCKCVYLDFISVFIARQFQRLIQHLSILSESADCLQSCDKGENGNQQGEATGQCCAYVRC